MPGFNSKVDWAFVGYQAGDDLDPMYAVIGTNEAIELRTQEQFNLQVNRLTGMVRDRPGLSGAAITVTCKSFVLAHAPTYAEALQNCMAELERLDSTRKWYEPKRQELERRMELGGGG